MPKGIEMGLRITYLAVIVTLLSQLPAYCQDSIPWTSDLTAAQAASTQYGAPLFIHFYSDNCPPCKMLEARAFKTPAVIQAARSQFIPVKINVDHNRKLADNFKVHSWPTDVLVSSSGQEIYRSVSPQDPDKYVLMLNSAASHNREMLAMANSHANAKPQAYVAQNTASNQGRYTPQDTQLPPRQPDVPASSLVQYPPAVPVAYPQVTQGPQQPLAAPAGAASVRSANVGPTQNQTLNPFVTSNAAATNPYSNAGMQSVAQPQPAPQQPNAAPATNAPQPTTVAKSSGKTASHRFSDESAPGSQTLDNEFASRNRNQASGEPLQVDPRRLLVNNPYYRGPAAQAAQSADASSPENGPLAATPQFAPSPGFAPQSTPQPAQVNASKAPTTSSFAASNHPVGQSMDRSQATSNPVASSNPNAASVPAKLASAQNSNVSAAPADLCLDGFCPVALQSTSDWVPGSADFAVRHRGRLYYLSNQEAVDRFMANPDSFSPALSGYDVVTFLSEGRLEPGSRIHGLWADDQVYLFSSAETRAQFAANAEGYMAKLTELLETQAKNSKR